MIRLTTAFDQSNLFTSTSTVMSGAAPRRHPVSCELLWLISLGTRSNMQHAHHLVVFVAEDVAVVHVAPGPVEAGHDPGDFAGVHDRGVLPAGLERLGRLRRAGGTRPGGVERLDE